MKSLFSQQQKRVYDTRRTILNVAQKSSSSILGRGDSAKSVRVPRSSGLQAPDPKAGAREDLQDDNVSVIVLPEKSALAWGLLIRHRRRHLEHLAA